MKKIIYTFLILFFAATPNMLAQDAAICGWDGSGGSTAGDEMAFVLLRDFTAGEVLYVSEDEYSDASNNFNTSEGNLAWTCPVGGLLEGTVITLTETSSGVYTAGGGGGSVVGTGSWSMTGADEVYIYSASNPADPHNSVTAVHCFAWYATTSPLADQEPAADYPSVILIRFTIGGSGGMNANFNDASRVNTTRAMLENGANWTQSTGNINFTTVAFTNQMLPVELIDFDANEKDENVHLNWSTASEINNNYFEIQHSVDGVDFERIGMVEGNGTTELLNAYNFIHKNPSVGINYYRLKQVDLDDKFNYTDAVAVTFNGTQSTVGVSPNPFREEVKIKLTEAYTRNTSFEIYDMTGRLVHSGIIAKDVLTQTVNLSSLDSGVFTLSIGTGEDATTQRIVKL